MTEFMGKTLLNPIIASSCIATENESSILRLAANEVQGAVLKSCADYVRGEFCEKREFAVDEKNFTYASSPFELEILTLEECICLLRKLRSQTDILLIPSFTAASLEPEDWGPACRLLEKEGADGIQLDFFYMGNLIGRENFGENIVTLLRELISAVNIPIMPKLNINLPKDYIIPLITQAGVRYVSLLDSVRSPYIEQDKESGEYLLSKRLDPATTSCFGGWQLPLTLGYTYTAAQYGLKVCAGGGVTCAKDVRQLLAAGAVAVQSATFLTKYPKNLSDLLI